MKHLFTILLLFPALSWSQAPNLDIFKNIGTRNIGPAGMSGRVTSIDVVEKTPDIIYIGTASGGVWRSKSGGISWEPIFDNQSIQNIGAIAVQQSNPDIIWVGTGEGNPRNSQSSGTGIYKSLNGGKTWKLMGLEKTATIHRIIIHKDNPDIVWIAATGSAWGDNTERGVYKTIDGGKTWRKVLYVNEKTGCADLIIDPSNPNKLIASMWEYRREPWFFSSGGTGSGLYITYDGGETWKKRDSNNGLPKGELGRIGLAICHTKPNIIYALVESEKLGLYRSEDGGFSWKLQSDKNVGNRPFYYADIYCDPINENRLYNLWSYVSLSEDGGKTFRTILDYGAGVHPDHHAFYIHPQEPNFIINGNDGGLNISRDRGENWRFIENLPVGQFYHVNYDLEIPYNVYGGLQDNGSWVGPAYVWKNGGIRNSDFSELYFGDGFDVVPIIDDSRFGYAMSQGGNLAYYDRITGKTQKIKPLHPQGVHLRFNWNAAISSDPFNSDGLYFGSQFLHYSNNRGQSWEIISPDLTTNDKTKQNQAKSGGLTIDATQAENYTTILCIAPSSIDPDIIWVGTDDGQLQLTTDRGKNWTNFSTKLKGAPEGAWIPQIHVSSINKGEAFVVLNNYRKNDWGTYVYHTSDFGNKWTRIANGEQVKGYALCILQDTKAENLLFLGTEQGLWFSVDKGQNWSQWTNNFPSVSTSDLKIHPRENDLIIGTFGRSLFIIDNILPIRYYAQNQQNLLSENLHLFELQESYISEFKEAEGVRFIANAHFKGHNKPSGAMIDFWIKEIEKDQKVEIIILNNEKDTIRNFTLLPDTGFNRIYWNFERNGIRYPSFGKKQKTDPKPGAFYIKPGTYQLEIKYGKYSRNGQMLVNTDPRLLYSENDYDAQWSMLNEHFATVKAATMGFNKLLYAEKTIDIINTQMNNIDDSIKVAIDTKTKILKDSIAHFQSLYTTPKDFVGYDHVTVRLNNRLYETTEYITNSSGKPSQMAELSYNQCKKETEKIINRINTFFLEDWNEYQNLVESIAYSPFKSYKPIQIKK